MITKQEVDRIYSERYAEFLEMAKNIARRKKRRFEPEIAVSEAYLKVLKKIERIKDEQHVIGFSKLFILKEIVYGESETNKRERGLANELTIPENLTADRDYRRETEHIIKTYLDTTNDVVKTGLLEMFIGGFDQCRTMAKEINVSYPSAHRAIVEMKEDLRRFAAVNDLL